MNSTPQDEERNAYAAPTGQGDGLIERENHAKLADVPTSPTSPLDSYLSVLYNETEDLGGTVFRLAEKLKPVLNQERFDAFLKDMSSIEKADPASQIGQSSFAGRISTGTEKARAARKVIEALIEFMEV